MTTSIASTGSLSIKLWRGERMCLIGMNMDPVPDPDFVGFAITVQSPGAPAPTDLRNRLNFSYPADAGVNGSRQYPTSQAPLQTFRWIHFPQNPKPGPYTYTVTAMHMEEDGVTLRAGDSASADIVLFDETVPGVVDIGFYPEFCLLPGLCGAVSRSCIPQPHPAGQWRRRLRFRQEQGAGRCLCLARGQGQ